MARASRGIFACILWGVFSLARSRTLRRSVTLGDDVDSPQGASLSPKNAERIDKVIETLSDILSSLENSQKEEASTYADYEGWCASTLQTTKDALDREQLQYDQGTVDEKEQLATDEHLKRTLADIRAERTQNDDMLAQANAMRDEEVDKYTEDTQLNKESISQISQAIDIVQKVHNQNGFLQNGVLKRLQVNEPGESSYVLGIMKQLREKLQKSRNEMDSAEQGRKSKHDQMVLTKKQQIGSLTQEFAAKQQKVAETGVGLVQTRRLIAQAEKQSAELNTILEDVRLKCEEKKKEWKVRSEDRSSEIASLRLAIGYLQGSKKGEGSVAANQATNFLQLRSKEVAAGSGEALAPVIGAFLSTADADLAAMGSDISDKNKKEMLAGAKKAVKNLIQILEQEQKDEKDMQGFCKGKIQSKDDEKATIDDEIALLTATIARKAAEIETLSSQVQQVEFGINASKKSLEEAGHIRKKEARSYETGRKDRALAIKVLKQAKAVLIQFYESQDPTSLIQTDEQAPPTSSQGSSRKKLLGMQAVDMMDKIIGEVEQEQKDAATAEKASEASFEKMKVDSVTEFDDAMSTITDKIKRRATLGVHLSTDKETLTQRQEDLDSVVQQLRALHEKCDELLANYERRTKARTFEVSQLKDVFDILSGSSIAARTGFLDKSASAGSDGELQLLQGMSQSVSDIEAKARRMTKQLA